MFFLTANNDKDAVKKLNRPGTDRENVFVKPDERLVSRTYRECLQFNTKETHNPTKKKTGKRLEQALHERRREWAVERR